ncbi:hypothetical protein AC579_9750 [Lecanosticta acicola]|uniref:BZIP domain-containing protein n=1 Tax=Lecanosticta acicola TaxID=111012 RepID=A0AAI9EDJ3_9PEZI|nr:hypothetical protein AC579_9750 [Lecanosticta acicola]
MAEDQMHQFPDTWTGMGDPALQGDDPGPFDPEFANMWGMNGVVEPMNQSWMDVDITPQEAPAMAQQHMSEAVPMPQQQQQQHPYPILAAQQPHHASMPTHVHQQMRQQREDDAMMQAQMQVASVFRHYSDGDIPYQHQAALQHMQGQPSQLSPVDQQHPNAFPAQFQHSPPRGSDAVPIPPGPSTRSSFSSVGSPGTQQNGDMVVQQSGPMSSSVNIPQRPRPGRKPIPQEDAADRRRLQNRIAQRNFRDKRQQKLQETLHELELKKREYQASVSDIRRNIESERQQHRRTVDQVNREQARANSAERRCNEKDNQIRALQKEVEELRRFQQMQSQNTGRFIPAPAGLKLTQPSPYTPPEDTPISPSTTTNYNDLETDYTARFASSNHNLRHTASNDSAMDFSYTQPNDDPCGFCTDPSNCLCAAASHEEKNHAEPAAPVNGPGSCDMCRKDPKRAQACRDLANSAQMGTRPRTGLGPRPFAETNVTTKSSMPPPPPMSCSSMIDAFNQFGERTSSIGTLFGGKLNAYPARSGGGYEIEETQAAEVLTALSRRSTHSEGGMTDAGIAHSRKDSDI